MFKSWTIIESAASKDNRGHFHWELEAITGELQRRGVEARVLTSTTVLPEQYPDAKLFPIFPVSPSSPVPEHLVTKHQKFDYHNRAFGDALRAADPSLFHDSLVLFPTVTNHHFRAIFHWLNTRPPAKRPKAVLVLNPMHKWPQRDFVVTTYEKIWTGVPAAVKDCVLLCVRSDSVADHYQRLFGIRPHVIPCPNGPSGNIAVSAEASAPMRVASFGGGRPKKGRENLPGMVARCAHLPVRFFLQAAKNDADVSAQILCLHDPPKVEIHHGPIERERYHDLMAHSVVLLPYRAEGYRWRFSGVYLEAVCLGAPVIVPAGTWMSAEVEEHGHGVVFDELSPEGLAAAVDRAHRQIGVLRQHAADLARVRLPRNGPAAYVDEIERLAAGRERR